MCGINFQSVKAETVGTFNKQLQYHRIVVVWMKLQNTRASDRYIDIEAEDNASNYLAIAGLLWESETTC